MKKKKRNKDITSGLSPYFCFGDVEALSRLIQCTVAAGISVRGVVEGRILDIIWSYSFALFILDQNYSELQYLKIILKL